MKQITASAVGVNRAAFSGQQASPLQHPFQSSFECAAAEFAVGAHAAAPRPARVAVSRLKRSMDITASALALLFLAPLLVLVALAIFMESGGPVLFRQPRCGLGGATFQILKFRTMYVCTSPDDRQVVRDDPRVTRVGRILRKLSIDELPQLANILMGDMSLVGPRPHAVSHDEEWAQSVPGYTHRYRARPGLTGLAQVQGHRGLVTRRCEIEERIAADNSYIDQWSLMVDVKILLKTAPLLLGDECAF